MLCGDDNELTEAIIGCAIDVHKELGPGLLETLYENALCIELSERQIPFQRQYAVPYLLQGTPAVRTSARSRGGGKSDRGSEVRRAPSPDSPRAGSHVLESVETRNRLAAELQHGSHEARNKESEIVISVPPCLRASVVRDVWLSLHS